MVIGTGGLRAECLHSQEEQTRMRMLCILEKQFNRTFEETNVVIKDSVDKVYYEIVDGKETKFIMK